MSKRYIMAKEPMEAGCYSAIQIWDSDVLREGFTWFSAELMDKFYMERKSVLDL